MSDKAMIAAIERRVADQLDPSRRIETLILALADAIKATSNDQNVQRLSRDLRAASYDLANSVAAPAVS